MITKPGFISNPYSCTRGDSVSAERVMKDIHDSAIRGCGCWYEIYHQRALNQIISLVNILSASDRLTLQLTAKKWGFNLDEESIKESIRACEEVYEELRRDQE